MTFLECCGPYPINEGPTLVAVRDGTRFSRKAAPGISAMRVRLPEPGERVRWLSTPDFDEVISGEGVIVSVTFEDDLPVCMVLWSVIPVVNYRWDPQF